MMAGSVLCVLFTDLAGSTELMTRLGDVAFDKLRLQHFAELRDVIAGAGGTEVKNTGDGLLATFTSAVQALAAATRMQQVTERQGRTAEVPLAVRVGLALGEVAVEDGDVFGTPVVEAARLVAAARPGQILATAVVRIVAGTRAGVSFADLGTLELKGLPDPVAVSEVEWEPEPATARGVPLPGLLLRTSRIFVGRAAELGQLRARWKEVVADGRRSLVLLGGEPGVGKTRLTAGLAQELHEGGALVLGGRCDEDMGVPYQPFVEALRHYVTHAPTPLRLGRHAGELARLVPELTELVARLPEPLRSDPETERYRLFDALTAWLADASTETPVLLILDDLQWAAKPTVLLLRHLLRASDPARLLVVATYRDTDQGAAFADFLTDLSRLPDTERLTVTGLDADGVVAFLEAAAGHTLDANGAALAQTVWRETEGNCFFVAEVLRHLAESGALEQRDGRWLSSETSVPIPEGVRDVIAHRLARLPENTNGMLTGASVVGLEFDAAVVQTAGSFDDDSLFDALEGATGARLIIELPGAVPRYRFSHALVRTTLYERMGAARRQSLHRRTAEAIEVIQLNHLDDYLPALAHHWAQAGTDPDKAVAYAKQAGDRALAQLAHDDAAMLYAQALDLIGPDDARRVELLISLGDAQRRAGDAAYRATLMAAARLAQAHGDADALGRAALANSRYPYWSSAGQLDEERVALLETALDATGGEVSRLRASLLAALAVELVWSGEFDRRVRLSDEAVRMARALDPPTLATTLISRFYAINSPDNLSVRLADSRELLDLAERLGDPIVSLLAHFMRARTSLESGDADEIAAHIPKAEDFAREVGQPTYRWMLGWLKTAQLQLAGRIADAERTVEATLALGRETGQPDAEHVYMVQLTLIRYEQGRLGEIERQLAAAAADAAALPGLSGLLALANLERGLETRAQEHFGQLRALSFEIPRDPLWLGLLSVAAEVARYLQDVTSASVLYELLSPYPSSFGVLCGSPVGCTDHFLGMLAAMTRHFDAADDHFRRAIATCERAGAPALVGRAQLEWARSLLARGRPEDVMQARTLLDQASAVAEQLDLTEVGRRAEALRAAHP